MTLECDSSIKNWMVYATDLFTHASVTLKWIVLDYNIMHVFKKLIHRDNGGKTVGEISCSEAAEFRMRFPLSTAGMGQKQLLLTETSSGFTRCANDPGIAVGHGDRILTLQVFQPLLGSVHEENYDLAPVILTESADFLLLFLL